MHKDMKMLQRIWASEQEMCDIVPAACKDYGGFIPENNTPLVLAKALSLRLTSDWEFVD